MSLLVGAASNGSSGYFLEDSLRFRKSAGAYLNRTPSGASNRKTFTLSTWVKRGQLGVVQGIFDAYGGGNDFFQLQFDAADKLSLYSCENPGVFVDYSLLTDAVYRDTSAWYHIVLVINTPDSTQADRAIVYVNGVRQSVTNPSGAFDLDVTTQVNTTNPHNLGRSTDTGGPTLDGYLTEINFVDGTALAPTDFGKTDDNGTWIPKKYTGTYGTNGFYLNFSNSSSVAALGTDFSGNSNTWTVNNVSLTSGDATYDLMSDVPTLTDEDTSNFATLNPNNMAVNTTMTDGNLKASNSVNHATMFPTNMPTTGKYYFECKMAVNAVLGLGFRTDTNKVESAYSDEANKYYYYLNNSNAYRIVETTNTAYGSNLNNTTSTFQVAIDFDAAKYYFGRDNTWYAADWGTDGDPASGTNPSYDLTDGTKMFPFVYVAGGTWTVNFGQQPFTYTPPSGFKKINTFNLPDSTIEDGSERFDTALYTGTGSTQSITGLEFQPDFLWLKARTGGSYSHHLVDAVRGNNKFIMSNRTDAEQTSTDQVTAFTSDGFTLGADSAGPNDREVNESSRPMVAWSWKTEDTTAKTYTVKVVSDSGNKYRFDDYGTSAVTLNLHESGTYTFDQSDGSNSGHPLRFSTTSDGTHGGGSEYTTGVTVTGVPGTAGAKTVIVVAASAPTLYYYCTVHSGMGGQANTNATKGSSNFDGSIISTVSPNPTAGFSIVMYSGNATSGATVGHGLGVAPEIVIGKTLSTGGYDWPVYVTALGDTSKTLTLNLTAAAGTETNKYNGTAPSATVVTLGNHGTNLSGTNNQVLYCFAPVEGYSKFGSYTGNGSADGPFVYTEFRPAFVITKKTNNTSQWAITDTARSTYNVAKETLEANTSSAESSGTAYQIDILSNGFKLRDADDARNGSGDTYIYMAFAENPFKNSNAR